MLIVTALKESNYLIYMVIYHYHYVVIDPLSDRTWIRTYGHNPVVVLSKMLATRVTADAVSVERGKM